MNTTRLFLATIVLVTGCAHVPPPITTLDTEPPRLVSAFFGLDNALPRGINFVCPGGGGEDGMPVTFSRRIVGAIEPASFSVRTKSGAIHHPRCATLFPANAAEKSHTVLLIGNLGDDPADPPIEVEVTGELGLERGASARGMSGGVIALADGPTLALALRFQPGEIPSDCPSTTKQIVVAIWTGGVKPGPAFSQTAHRDGYRIDVGTGEARAFALGDIGDSDNYVHVCLDVASPARRVSFEPGVLVDPRGDLNPATAVAISGPP